MHREVRRGMQRAQGRVLFTILSFVYGCIGFWILGAVLLWVILARGH